MDLVRVANVQQADPKTKTAEDDFDIKAVLNQIAAPATRLASKLRGKKKDAPNSSISIFPLVSPKCETAGADDLDSRNVLPSNQLEVASATVIYNSSMPVPGSKRKKMIYTLAPVKSEKWTPDEYSHRFGYVVGELRKAVEADHDLRHRSRYINYAIRMVGTSPQTARPSIVVFCRTSDLKALQMLFQKRATDRLYCHRESHWFQLFKADAPSKPPFRLVYYQTDHDPLLRNASDEAVLSPMSPDNTFCGSLITCQGRVATVALTVEVDGVDHLLTVEHIWDRPLGPDQCNAGDVNSIASFRSDSHPATLNGDEMVSLDPLWVDDSEDDDLTQPVLSHSTIMSASQSRYTNTETSTIKEPASTIHGIPVVPPWQLSSRDQYLDWLCLKADAEQTHSRRCNFIFPDRYQSPVLLQKVAEKPRAHGTAVYMVSGVRGIQTGLLVDSLNYLGSQPGQALTEAWTMVPHHSGMTCASDTTTISDANRHLTR